MNQQPNQTVFSPYETDRTEPNCHSKLHRYSRFGSKIQSSSIELEFCSP